jgi:hypothetical protein
VQIFKLVLLLTVNVRTNNAEEFYKVNENQIIKLQIAGNNLTDETAIVFTDFATENFDNNFDALKLFSPVTNAPQIYSVSNDFEYFAINSLNILDENTTIQLGLRAETEGEYSISLSEINLTDFQNVYLFDSKLNKITNLTNAQSYNFEYFTNDNPFRFVLMFSETTNVCEELKNNVNIYSQNNTFIKNRNFVYFGI